MRKLLLAIILLITGFCLNAQDSVIVYEFKNFSFILVSRGITDSSFNQSKERVVSVHNEFLGLFVTTNKNPLLQPVTMVKLDTVTQSTTIKDLEMQAGFIHSGTNTGWQDVDSFPLLRDSISIYGRAQEKLPAVKKGDYNLPYHRPMYAYGERFLHIRNKNTKEEIINFRFTAIDLPVVPFLTNMAQGIAQIKQIDSFRQITSRMFSQPNVKIVMKGTERVLEEVKKAPEIPMLLKDLNLPDTSEMVFYFKGPPRMYPDSSMEYRLLNEPGKDTNWIKTGHQLIISNLVHGEHYKLQVRYELHPGHIEEHTFYVVPKWYQTTQTKIIFGGVAVLAALFAWLIIYNQRLKKSRRRKEQLSLEIKSIRSQLNPHFIFNALASIQGLINKNDIPAANKYLTEFSTLLRESLHNHEKEMVPLITEINLMETYLKLEQLRFNFKYTIHIDESINKNATEIPNLILQPLIENAVKHGVSALGEKGLIKIDFIKRDRDLLVLITDNGNHFDETKLNNGFGLKLTRNRISLLKEQPIKLTIERRQDMETIVSLAFTNWI